jgi:hypothetical protein
MKLDWNALPDIVKGIVWFIGAVGGPVLTAVWVALAKAKYERRKAEAALPPIQHAQGAPSPANPFDGPPPTDPGLRIRLEEIRLKVALNNAESLVEELQRDRGALLRKDAAREEDAQRIRAALVSARMKYDAAGARIATLEQALENETAARAQAEAEIVRLKSSESAKTPLLPKAIR